MEDSEQRIQGSSVVKSVAVQTMAVLLLAMAVPAQNVHFDVATVRPHQALPHERTHIYSDPRVASFRAQNITLKALLQYAYAMPESRILNAPAWAAEKRWDVEARGDESTTATLAKLPDDKATKAKLTMIQELLGERFGVTTRPETRLLPVYNLIVGKEGPKLKETQQGGLKIDNGRGSLTGQGMTTAMLAQELARSAGRVVLDTTGLKGRYDIDLKWRPEDAGAGQSESERPSLLTAVQEQLGLRLKPANGPVEVLVLDKATEPIKVD